MLRLQTLGGLALVDEAGAAVATQRRRLALFALLAVAGKRGLTRDKLVAYLWPERPTENARHALEQLLYAVRRQLGDELFLGADPLRLNPAVIESDVDRFGAAVAGGADPEAVAQYGGPFLDGFYLNDAEEFERWTETERARLTGEYGRALERLARDEAERGHHAAEVQWRRRLVALDPLAAQGAVDLMRALEAAGDRASALQHARVYAALVRQELSSPPDDQVTALVNELQVGRGPAAPASRKEFASAPAPIVAARVRRPWQLPIAAALAAIFIIGAVWALASRRGSLPSTSTSIAVLPFTNLSGNADDEYFSDGMTEELISALSKVEGLRVAARTSAFAFKNRKVGAREIGNELHVGTLVEGTVRRSAQRVRITARVINAVDGYQRWSDEYERDIKDVFAVQDEISRAIVNALEVTLVGGKDAPLVSRPTASPEAYDLYLKGRYFFGLRVDEAQLRKSAEYFERAIRLDSTYALAYSGLSDALSVLSIWGFVPPRDGFPRAKAAALRALGLDSTLAEAHTSSGIISLWFDLDGETARRELTRAIALDPRYPPAHLFYAWYLTTRGDTAAAVEEARRTRDLDPLSVVVNTRVASMLYYARRYEDALVQLHTTLELDSTNALAHAELARVFVRLGRCPEALAAIHYIPASFPNVEGGVTGYAYAACGRRAEAVRMLRHLQGEARRGFVFASRIALLDEALGARDEAFIWLDRAIDQRDPTSELLPVEPLYDALRTDPRFPRLLAKAGL
jgi:TolB-like protein/DNA-binding SARP family transcriptional activator